MFYATQISTAEKKGPKGPLIDLMNQIKMIKYTNEKN